MTSREGDPTQQNGFQEREGSSFLHNIVDGILKVDDPTYSVDHPARDGVRHAVAGGLVGARIVFSTTAEVLRRGVEVTLNSAGYVAGKQSPNGK